MAIAEWHQIADDQRMMCVLPLHHVNGIVVTLITPLYAGAGVVLNQQFHTDEFFERISAERVSIVSVVPTVLQFLLHANLAMEAYKLQHFRHFICGAGPLTVELASKFEQNVQDADHPRVRTVGDHLLLLLPPARPAAGAEHRVWLSKYGFPSIGVPLPVNEMAIHDAGGNELGEGERGEIVIRGHNVMRGYLRTTPRRTSRRSRTGGSGAATRDSSCRTRPGRQFFFITGRFKELIIRGGANISPFEIDEILMHIPGVKAGIAVGFDNDWYGEEVGAYVVRRKDRPSRRRTSSCSAGSIFPSRSPRRWWSSGTTSR